MSFPRVPVRRIARILNGGTPPSGVAEFWDGVVPFVTPPDLNGLDGAPLESTTRTITTEGVAHSGLAPADSVLLSTRAPIGHVGRLTSSAAFNQGCRALVPSPDYEARFLAYALVAGRADMDARGLGTTFLELSGSSLAQVEVPLVPRSEQHAIADYLDRETAHIDAFIAKNEELIALLTERRAASIDGVMAEYDGSRLRLKYRLEANTGGVWGEDPTGVGDTVVLRSTEQTVDGDWRIESPALRALSRADARRFRLREGDLVVTKSSGSEAHIGKATLVDSTVATLAPAYSNFMQRLTPSSAMNPKFLWYALRSRTVRDQLKLMTTSTTGLGNLNGGILGNLQVPAPTLKQQSKAVAELDQASQSIDAAISCANEAARLARERRAALISAAVTGKIDIASHA